MAINAYDEPINKEIPWDGNKVTGDLPVRGSRIEEFLKKTLDSKMGIIYYDTQHSKNLVFADVSSRDMYLEDPEENKNLILGSFDAPSNYIAEIKLSSPSYTVIDSGTKGTYLEFTFSINSLAGAPTGEGVDITYTFSHNSTQKVIKETRKFGEKVSLNIDDYLLTGTNIVTINIVGQTSLVTTTTAITYQVLSLTLTDEMDITKVYNLTTDEDTLVIPYTLSGQGTKMVEWYIDGVQITSNTSEDEGTDTIVNKIKYIPLNNLSSGVHNIQIRAYTLINGEKFYTDTLYREIMVNNGDINEILIAIKAIIPKEYGIISNEGPFTLYKVEQYLPKTLEFTTSKSTDVAIKFGKNESKLSLLSTIKTVQGIVTSYSITPSTQGNYIIVLSTADGSRIINIPIATTTLDIKEITDSLEFHFTSRGRNNSVVDKDIWSGFGYTATFEGFKWNDQSGWVDNALLINDGASISFNYAPLATDSVSTGKTIELEFATRNVDNDNAVICDLRNSDGTGLLITASEAKLISRVGSTVYTKFKSDDRNRIAFVINRNINVVNKNLVFIYVNGILSGAINYGSADNYFSEKLLSFRGTVDAHITLYDIRIYNIALSSSQLLNNYTLYRDTIEDMRYIYNRNDVLEDGRISLDKTRHGLPIMIITGDLLDLDEKSDTDYYITANIDYYNDQDPLKNFKIDNARIRIQGTSSRFYPRKNYRFYTNKADFTILYDSQGNVVKDGLYAFTDNAQPVDCWCLKADFAESSGTHNTGVARIWNDVMVNASFSHTNNSGVEVSGYPLRTQAQIKAKKEGFTKDVRTTIDGFPILLFRRNTKNDAPIFVGKYNFNNDKSTPNVFGFTDIPNFDDSKVQSWECLENEDPIALFKTVDGFFDDAVDAEGKSTKRWELAFEARHEGVLVSVNDLYDFCSWVVSKNGKAEEFATEKWEHMDVYKVAAYYVYLMRFGALDQVVKNCFLTSEDGIHFYFINYDNDTILGVDNTGEISALPDIDRQSQYANGSYVYAGHESVLWNMLEADSEFMSIVRIVDTALYSAGLTYKAVLEMFNEKQSDKWVERVYNEDAQYKYVAPYTNKGVNYLSSLQGSRKSHRTWWLSKRFALCDSLFASGDFTAKSVEIKCISGTPAGLQIGIVSGTDMNYGYGLNRVPREIGVYVPFGDSHTFTVDSELGIGTPVAIYAAPYLRSLDISSFAPYINTLNISNVSDSILGSRLKTLILGASGIENTNVNAISGIDSATRLQTLDIKGFKGITSLDLSKQTELISLDATSSGLASVTFAKGAPITTLKFPSTMLALNLEQLPKLSIEGLTFESLKNISSINIKGCPLLSNDISLITTWLDVVGDNVYLDMDNVVWENVDYTDLIKIGGIQKINLKGYAKLTEVSQEIVDTLSEVFGSNIFDSNSEFYIDAPESVFINGPSEILEGDSAQYTTAVFPATMKGTIRWSISSSRAGTNIDSNGLLTTTENGSSDATITVECVFLPDGGAPIDVSKNVTIKKRIYPSTFSIDGDTTISGNESTYRAVMTDSQPITGKTSTEWSLTGDIVNYVRIKSYTTELCVLEVFSIITTGAVSGALSVTFKKATGEVLSTKSINITAIDDTIAEIDPTVCSLLYNAGLCANSNFITKEEAKVITEEQLMPNGTSIFKSARITSFSGFKYFTSLVTIPENLFYSTDISKSLELPPNIISIKEGSFSSCRINNIIFNKSLKTIEWGNYDGRNIRNITIRDVDSFFNITRSVKLFSSYNLYLNDDLITEMVIPNNVTVIEQFLFSGCKSITNILIHNSVTSIGKSAFYECTGLTSIEIPNSVTSIGSEVFGGCTRLTNVVIGNGVTSIGSNMFSACTNLTSITIGSSITSIGYNAFGGCKNIKEIISMNTTAPRVDSTAFSSIGYNVEGTKTLYVPVNATGYDASYWLDPLQNPDKCGFTISKTL